MAETSSVDWSYLDAFDSDFVPKQQGFRDKIDLLPDGPYDLTIVDALGKMAQGVLIIEIGVQPVGGAVFTHSYWLDKQGAVNALGADLAVLGFPADQWQRAGKKLAAELPAVLEKLAGIHFRAVKAVDRPKTGQYAGKEFHKLKFISRISNGGMMPPSIPFNPTEPNGTPAGMVAGSTVEDLPF